MLRSNYLFISNSLGVSRMWNWDHKIDCFDLNGPFLMVNSQQNHMWIFKNMISALSNYCAFNCVVSGPVCSSNKCFQIRLSFWSWVTFVCVKPQLNLSCLSWIHPGLWFFTLAAWAFCSIGWWWRWKNKTLNRAWTFLNSVTMWKITNLFFLIILCIALFR